MTHLRSIPKTSERKHNKILSRPVDEIEHNLHASSSNIEHIALCVVENLENESDSSHYFSPTIIYDLHSNFKDVAWNLKIDDDVDEIKIIDNIELFLIICKKLQKKHNLPDAEINLLIETYKDLSLLIDFATNITNLDKSIQNTEDSYSAAAKRFGDFLYE